MSAFRITPVVRRDHDLGALPQPDFQVVHLLRVRFDVLRDEKDPDVYYFYEVYRDQAALDAHRATPHYAVWRAAADALDGATEAIRCTPVFPADRASRGKA